MSYRGAMPGYGGGDDPQAAQSGGKRKKLAGYLKAANELRQAYSATWNGTDGSTPHYDDDVPGAFPDASVIRGGDEEMVLFPGYARKHIRTKPHAQPGTIQEVSGTGRDYRDTVGAGDAEFWKEQWEQYENDKAVVDVDVRGWIYNPHRGPMSRKHRLMVGLARQLVGLPAPAGGASSSNSSRPTSRSSSPVRDSPSKQEEEMVSKQAEEIVRRGETEATIAGLGGFSERPSKDSDGRSIYGGVSRSSSPVRNSGDHLHPSRTNTSTSSLDADISPLQKRSSWTHPAKMSAAELSVANGHLMARLKPFMANPIANAAISAFFYNDQVSRQRTVYTDASGHFHMRAALDFVPTHVRVLASEKLSATEEVQITSSRGVSMISDIDDTIKHSAITSGAREIFRNAFIRDLGDLTIDGVKQWYNNLADIGVKVHYVSNSPWQLYPVLTTFFKMAGLPNGSYHLKQYSGMLQGIFEPVAERKKATLDRLMADFPDRKFILIGDSGEADIEVYTDVVCEYPGRILGVFIRDVTTSYPKGGFFDPSMGPLSGSGFGKQHRKNTSMESLSNAKQLSRPDDIQDDESELRAAIAASLKDMEAETARTRRSIFLENPVTTTFPDRPQLPPRRPTDPPAPQASAIEENLIDFSDDESPSAPPPAVSYVERQNPRSALNRTQTDMPIRKASTPPPPPPAKPAQFRVPSGEVPTRSTTPGNAKSPPPKPRKPSTTINTNVPSPLSQNSPIIGNAPEKQGYGAAAKKKLNSAYNHLPSAPSYLGGSGGRPGASSTEEPRPHLGPRSLTTMSARSVAPSLKSPVKPGRSGEAPPPPPPRRNLSSYPAAAAHYASNKVTGTWSSDNNGSASNNDPYGSGAQSPVNKKEEMWKRRWQRAKEIMEAKGVILRAWRVGSDVEEVSIKLVQDELKKVDERDKEDLQRQQEESKKKERQEEYRRKQRRK